jgi:high-affinity nickel-transport protein
MGASIQAAAERPRLTAFWLSLDRGQRRTLIMMAVVVVGLHVAGFVTLIALVTPHHYRLGSAGAFTVGIGITAYTLGMRHAFDADHIAAIDNTTRKLMSEGKRPLSVGFWFSLGHSTIVFILALLLSLGIKALAGPVKHDNSSLHQVDQLDRNARVRQLPVSHRGAQRGGARRDHQGLS